MIGISLGDSSVVAMCPPVDAFTKWYGYTRPSAVVRSKFAYASKVAP